MSAHPRLPIVLEAASSLAAGLVNPTLLVTLHRDIDELEGLDGRRLGRSNKQYALRWAIFTMSYAALESFFNDILRDTASQRTLPVNPDKLRSAGDKHGVKLFTSDWGLRTRVKGTSAGNRSRWVVYSGKQELVAYLADMKNLRDLLAHGSDPNKVSNASGALWPLINGGNSMRLMGAEGFIQAAGDLAAQTVLAFGGEADDVPVWPEPARSGLSAEPRPVLKLLEGRRAR
ncbi:MULTISPECIES: hypothetical protein [Pseudonocardia]|uniref:Uncharacterized protein n=1 Tax=Pseudonocardia ammonioxydans TaxID=260086 RepID=A0A1I5I7P1_PSUAM|nr:MULTISPECIES: hypothetical protein [Pseudonocardia]OLM20082.1 hypothetical protein Ae707Ps1_4341 [Pseudonocardia sp. Ae707_Ps1]SFO56634.1 hypothetical protein SAMN05216207_10909 [Pseudonocardia ammonioxydans]